MKFRAGIVQRNVVYSLNNLFKRLKFVLMGVSFPGFHGVVSFCVVILMPSLDSASKKQAASVPCRPKQLTAFTKHLVDVSLTNFVSTTFCIFIEENVSQPLS